MRSAGPPGAWTLGSSRMRLLALLSSLATGLVIWAGASHEDSSSLAAAVAHRRTQLASAEAAASATHQPAASEAAAPPGGEAPAEATIEPAAPATPAASQAAAVPAPSIAPVTVPQAAEPSAPAQAPAGSSSPLLPAPSAATPVGPATTPASKIKHVFVITLASPGYEQTWGPTSQARYLTTQLRPLGTLLANYFAIGHLDLPNFIAMISGQPPNPQTAADCPTFAQFPPTAKPDAQGRLEAPGCVYPTSVLTLADQLTSTRRLWHAYLEGLANGPKPVQSCRHPAIGQPDETQRARPGDGYAARHNPFVYFHSLLDLGDCESDDLPLTRLPADLGAAAKTPNYSFIVPNLCHDGSEAPCPDGSAGGLAAADSFLAEWVPKILASAAYRRDGLLVITFGDGPASDSSGCCQGSPTAPAASVQGGGRVGALLLSPFLKPGGESTTPYNHYSLLRTLEDIFGVSHLGEAAQPSIQSFAGDVLRAALAKRG